LCIYYHYYYTNAKRPPHHQQQQQQQQLTAPMPSAAMSGWGFEMGLRLSFTLSVSVSACLCADMWGLEVKKRREK